MDPLLLLATAACGALLFFAAIKAAGRFRSREAPPVPEGNRRVAARYPVKARCEMFWQDGEGNASTARAWLRDLSDHGACLAAPQYCGPDTLVVLRVPEYHLGGSAHVRRCEPKGRSWEIGLRFNGPLTRSV
jgi:hypothetical protein